MELYLLTVHLSCNNIKAMQAPNMDYFAVFSSLSKAQDFINNNIHEFGGKIAPTKWLDHNMGTVWVAEFEAGIGKKTYISTIRISTVHLDEIYK